MSYITEGKRQRLRFNVRSKQHCILYIYL